MRINEEEKKQPAPMSTHAPINGKKGSGANTVTRLHGKMIGETNDSKAIMSMPHHSEDFPDSERDFDMFTFIRNIDE